MNITYRQLQAKLLTLTPEQLDTNVTVSCDVSEEAFTVKDLVTITEDDVLSEILDCDQPVLTIDF